MALSLKIAWRFLSANKNQTLLIMLGIAVGVAVQVFIGLLIQGLQKNLVQTTVGNSAQVTVSSTREDRYILTPNDVIAQIEEDGELQGQLKVVSGVSDSPVFIKLEQRDVSGFLKGFDLERAAQIYRFEERLEGNMPLEPNQVIIGKVLAQENNLSIGDQLTLTVPTLVLFSRNVQVVGIFDLGVGGLNASWIVTNLPTAWDIIRRPNTMSSIEMQVNDVFSADVVATRVKQILGDGFKVSDWKTSNADLLTALSSQSVSSIMIQTFVIIAVALSIASVLIINVVQKSRQLGILKAMGIRDGQARMIFLNQGLLLGVGGTIIGLAMGIGLILMFTTFARTPEGSPVVPVFINYGFIALSSAIAIGSSLVAAIIPARRSAKLSPVEVIRNG